MKAGEKPKQDVQFIARTISYDIRGDEVLASTQNFEVLEVGAAHPAPERQTGSVQFTGGISKEDALKSLRVVSEAIEQHGLPRTMWRLPRDYAEACLSLQQATGEMFAALRELPENLQTAYLPLLQ